MNNVKLKPNFKEWLKDHAEIYFIFLAIGLELVMEMLCRHNPLKGIAFLAHPYVFIYNCLIVYLTLTIALYFRRRRATLLFITLVWIGLATANCVVTCFRTTPFSAMDLLLIFSVWSIFKNYLNVFQMILILIGFIAAITLVVFAFIKMPKARVYIKRAIISTLCAGILLFSGYFIGLRNTRLSDYFYNLVDAYNDYGFAYCFSVSIFDRGISKPDEYSDEAMNEIIEDLENDPESLSKLPNVVMLQLESFFDPKLVKTLEFSEDPVPVFTKLKETNPHAFITVPSIGAGTANTEFEVLTGMSLDYFGAGEYPYQTVLKNSTCESANFNMKACGYNCHAVHNHSGTFYDRHKVYPMLGFDTFTSLEYMPESEPNPIGWAQDEILTDCILDALDMDGKRDFVYAISVQAHGKYPDEPLEGFTPTITASGLETEEEQCRWDYFLTELHETDRFIGELIEALKTYDEPVVLVMFGDHLPNLEITAEMFENGDLFQTEYIVWSNFGLDAEARDLYAYQLTAYVQELIGVSEGCLAELHQECASDPDYQEKLEMLEYDMLYGDQICFNGSNPYEPTELQMGVKTIELYNMRRQGLLYCVDGLNFTPYSVVMVEDKECETIYVNPKKLLFSCDKFEEGDHIEVAQIGEDGTALSGSNVIFFAVKNER